jgi:predicted acylesterase/phospholipase RssA
MPYNIEVLSVKAELYSSIKTACDSLNRVQSEFVFSLPPDRLKNHFFLNQRNQYLSVDVFKWIREYRQAAGGNRVYTILVLDNSLSSAKLSNLFGINLPSEGISAFTVNDFDQFVNDIVRYCRYYLVRYAIGFLQPELRNHDDPKRKTCIFHRKMHKVEIRDSLNSGAICEVCYDKIRPKLNIEISEAISSMLLIVSNQHPYSIVIKGGGVKGLAFAGALLELEKYFSFDVFAGTSAGAIAAILLGAGYKPVELLEILSEKNFNEFKDASFFGAILNLITKNGLYPGDEIENWMKKLLKKKFPAKLNDVELFELSSHTIVYCSRIKDGRLVFDSKKERMNTHASFAARCSMSIPYFFCPVLIDGVRVYDGGLRANFPLKEFMESYPSKPTIGLYLVSDSKKGGLVIGELTNIAIDGEELSIVENNLDKVVVIDPRPVQTTDFNLSDKKKELLILSGRLGALRFIERNNSDIVLDENIIAHISNRIEEIRREL